MRKVKIAQIGINRYSHAIEVFNSLKRQKDIFEFVGIVLPENEKETMPHKYEQVKDFPELTLQQVLEDPTIEAVAIETDEIYLTKYALLAAGAGKHIHMEKPGGRELSQFEELIKLVKQTGKVFHTGYMYRYNPYIIDLLERVRAGELGQILSVEAQMNCIHPRQLRQWLGQLPGGMMFYLGCHLVDLILLLQGQPKSVLALNTSTHQNTEAEDFGMAVFTYENGVSFAKTTAREIGGYARRQLVVTGTEATVEIKPLEMFIPQVGHFTEKTEYTEKAWNDRGVRFKTPIFNRYDGMMAGFASYVRGEKENPYTPDYELELYKLVLRACGVEL